MPIERAKITASAYRVLNSQRRQCLETLALFGLDENDG